MDNFNDLQSLIKAANDEEEAADYFADSVEAMQNNDLDTHLECISLAASCMKNCANTKRAVYSRAQKKAKDAGAMPDANIGNLVKGGATGGSTTAMEHSQTDTPASGKPVPNTEETRPAINTQKAPRKSRSSPFLLQSQTTQKVTLDTVLVQYTVASSIIHDDQNKPLVNSSENPKPPSGATEKTATSDSLTTTTPDQESHSVKEEETRKRGREESDEEIEGIEAYAKMMFKLANYKNLDFQEVLLIAAENWETMHTDRKSLYLRRSKAPRTK